MSINNPFVSVVIPTFNRARIIGNAIESVLDQHYQPLEVIVVDDGSSDDTEAVVNRFGPCVRYVRQDNGGPSSARNHGARISRGEILMFLDSDDIWLPGKVKHQVSLLNAAGPDVVCCVGNAVLHGGGGRNYFSFEVSHLRPKRTDGLWTNPAAVLSTRFLFFSQIASIRREAFLALGGFDESMRALEDWDFALRLALCSPCSTWAYTSEVLASYYFNTEGSLIDIAKKDLVALKEVALRLQTRALDLARANPGTSPTLMPLLSRKVSTTRRELYVLRLATSLPAPLGRYLQRANEFLTLISRNLFPYPAMEVEPLDLVDQACGLPAEETAARKL